MAKKKQQEEELLVDMGEKVTRIERFIEENKQLLSYIATGFVVLVGGIVAFREFYQKPRAIEAREAFFQAQIYFEQDSLQLALNGDGQNMGALDVAAEYGGTEAGNLANYYAGIAYLNLGEYENAIRLLDEFKGKDPMLKIVATGAIGDAFMELGQTGEALDYYHKASRISEVGYTTPFYLKKAGLAAEMLSKYDQAVGYYQRIKEEYPESQQGVDIDRYLAFARTKAKTAP